jgi:GT2 family glycosyltransferase
MMKKRNRGSALLQAEQAFKYFQKYGLRSTLSRYRRLYEDHFGYDEWLKKHRCSEKNLIYERDFKFTYAPRISLLVPVYNVPEIFLKQMMESVLAQSYGNWQLCIADGSDQEHSCRQILERYAERDRRISLLFLDQNGGISANTNAALSLVKGEYTALIDQDDFLEPDALFEIIRSLNHCYYDIIYTDEDKYDDKHGRFTEPNLKPDFDIDLLRSYNYITHLFVVRTDLLKKVGGLHEAFDGSQDYDLILRCVEKTDKISHIPKILYHWRRHAFSTSQDPDSKMYSYKAGKKALEEHLKRMNLKGTVEMLDAPYYGRYRIRYDIEGQPLVSIIIPNHENKGALQRCISSILQKNIYANIEIIIAENGSTSEEIKKYYQKINQEKNIRIVKCDMETFSFSHVNNEAVKYAKGEYLLLLNNDTELISSDAIADMLGYCQRQDVGAVGAKLFYPDDRIQHAGVIVGLGGSAAHVFLGAGKDDIGYMARALVSGDYSAVTGACMMIRKDLFQEVDGFDEEFELAFNDIDLCLKIRQKGLLIVYDAFAKWYHYESLSRGYENSAEKQRRFQREKALFVGRWRDILNHDPYYNPNFRLDSAFRRKK